MAKIILNVLREKLQKTKNDQLTDIVNLILSLASRVQPVLGAEAFEILTNNKLEFASSDSDIKLEALEAIGLSRSDLGRKILDYDFCLNEEQKLFLLGRYLSKYNIDNFPNLDKKLKDKLAVAYNMRFCIKQEFDFALNKFGVEKIAEMHFSGQQRCLNILTSQLYKEHQLGQDQALTYRKNPTIKETSIFRNNSHWLIPASFKAQGIFGCTFPSFIKQTEKYMSVHNAVYWLPEPMSEIKNKSFAHFVQNNLIFADNKGEKQIRNLSEIEVIAKNWKTLNPDEEKFKYKEILALCKSRQYTDIEYSSFAEVAAKWGISERTYKNIEGIYKAGLKVPEPFDSHKEFRFGKYCGRFLPRSDVRTGFFGNYTDCCQHFVGTGKACAISTVLDPYSQLFVIENEKGEIIAGSWVWENTQEKYRNVCFDNIEAIGDYAQNPILNRIYKLAGQYLIKEGNCCKVTIGIGCQDANTKNYLPTNAIPLPDQYGNQYSDADIQVLLADNPQAPPFNERMESQIYIRDVCQLDKDILDKNFNKFSPHNRQTIIPEQPTGVVLVDKNKGIGGCCLCDQKKHIIYDLKISPEYCQGKNDYARKLFGELIRTIKDINEEWQIRLGDKMTASFLKEMSKVGLISLKNNDFNSELYDNISDRTINFRINPNPNSTDHSSEKMEFIEVQTGATLDESDIVRYQDSYGRVK